MERATERGKERAMAWAMEVGMERAWGLAEAAALLRFEKDVTWP
jgi:hypothetical protein